MLKVNRPTTGRRGGGGGGVISGTLRYSYKTN